MQANLGYLKTYLKENSPKTLSVPSGPTKAIVLHMFSLSHTVF